MQHNSSDLRANGVSSVMASSLMGNSTFVNEKHYPFDVSNLEEKERICAQETNSKNNDGIKEQRHISCD